MRRRGSLSGRMPSNSLLVWLAVFQALLILVVILIAANLHRVYSDFRLDKARAEYLGVVIHGIVASHRTSVAPMNPPPDLHISVRKIGDFLDDEMVAEHPVPLPQIRFGNDWPLEVRIRTVQGELPAAVLDKLARLTYAEDFFVDLCKTLVEHGQPARIIAHLDQSRAIAFNAKGIWIKRPDRHLVLAWSGGILLAVMLLWIGSLVIVSRKIRGIAGSLLEAVAEQKELGAARLVEFREVEDAINEVVRSNIERDSERVSLLAAVSHDLHTPFTRLRLHAEFIKDETVQKNMLKDLDEIDVMIDESMRFLKREDRREDIQVVDIVSLVQSLCDDTADLGEDVVYRDVLGPDSASGGSPGSQQKSIRIWVNARPFAMRRAIQNVIRNAVRYGGKAEVRIQTEGDQVEILVDDPGPGIPEEYWDKVHLPFFRIEKSRSKGTGGTGLGLATAKSVIDDLSGHLSFSHTPDNWFRVTISLETTGQE